MSKKRVSKPAPKVERHLFAEFAQGLREAKEALARVEEMYQRGKVRFVRVPETKVRGYVRNAHWRAYYPPLIRSKE